MKGYKMKLPPEVSRILGKLAEHGYEAYVVGGCVRDALLGREPEDWDITTSAKPVQVKKIFSRTVDTGLQHGTVTVLVHGRGYEVTTYRVDGEYEDGRHPKEVAFTTSLRMDLERRDFTINAMAYNEKDGLVDEFDGIGDLERGIIRCVGDAGQRFDEDALRMLRAVRFSGQLGFRIEKGTRLAIAGRVSSLSKISAERIRVEIVKLLVSDGAAQLMMAYELGMTGIFMPEFDDMMECDQHNHHHIYTVGEHSIHGVEQINRFFAHDTAVQVSDYARRKLYSICDMLDKKQHMILVTAMLLHDVAKPEMMVIDEEGVGHFTGHPERGAEAAGKIMRRLTFDNVSVDTAVRLIRYHDYRMEPTARAVRRAASRIGKDIVWMEFLMQYCDVLSQNPETFAEKLERLDEAMQIYEEVEAAGQPLCVRELAVNGRDLIAAGIEPGPELGRILQQLLEIVLQEPGKNTREELLEYVKKELNRI